MADEDLKPGEGDTNESQGGSDTGAENGDNEQQDSGAESPYAELATQMGWVPRDQFQGAPEEWKPADRFILDGRDIQRDTSRELKTVRSQLENLTRTSASIVEQQVKERVSELTDRYNKAVEDGRPQEAFDLAKEITTISAKPVQQARSPDAEAFAERNSAWFNKPGHEYATARAVEICNTLAAQGYTDHGTQLRIAEQRLKQEMPQLFDGTRNGVRKDPPGVNAPGSRSPAPSNRAKGFADMPKEAQDIARDMVERKVIPNTEAYVKNYFANIAGRA